MKQPRFFAATAALSIALGLSLAGPGLRAEDSQSLSSRNMRLVGVNDLQARSAYQPTLHKYPQSRYILFTGHHALNLQGERLLPHAQPLPSLNPLTGKNEENGTSIVDVSDPRRPQYLFHIPVPNGQGGGGQMVRVCDGRTLPVHDNKIYMLRSYGNSAHEIWDVTNPSHPVGVRTVAGGNPVIGAGFGVPGALAGTHKNWWECDTGIAYIIGQRGNDSADGWKPGNHVFIFDLRNPANPVYLRDWALDGQQPGGAVPPQLTNVPSIHGPISTGPAGGDIQSAGATANRVYLPYGTSSNGVMQIVDRNALLPPPWGRGAACGSISSTLTPPACTDFRTAELGRLIMNPDNGAHTSWPLGRIVVPDFITDTGNDGHNTTRDIVVVVSEETAHFCSDFRHLTFMTDVTTEVRPQSIATAQVPAAGGGFCGRGGRFGPHATNEEFGPPFYKKIVFISYFNAGVRAYDVRDPYNPQEVAHFIPAISPNTDYRCGPFQGDPNVCRRVVQTNNVATDDRGYIYIVDRANTGLHVLQLTGEAQQIAAGKD